MPLRELSTIRRIGIVGGGVIGSGWAGHFLAKGFDVTVYDPQPDAKEKVKGFVRSIWPALQKIGLTKGASVDRLTVAPTMEDAVRNADFVQECGPDDRQLKRKLFKALDAATSPDVVIASSTSGIPMSEIQVDMTHPERAVVGHPFNPPYLMPLVEVVGGTKTSSDVVDWTVTFYNRVGKKALRIETETLGFIANRLQEAIWREALHMIAAGEATVEQIDTAVTDGPGLRWAIMGPCVVSHLAGGEGGIAHCLKHFASALSEPWSRMIAPELSDNLCQRLEEGCHTITTGRSISDLEKRRDEDLIAILSVLGRLPKAATDIHEVG
jgi:carnitine 3-dehydrogenase